ncbi:phosphotransferase family protein [Patescibacteria group bacterium]
MKQQHPVEQILDKKVMESFFREHFSEIVPEADEYVGLDLKMIRRFDGTAFYNKDVPVTTIRARYKIKYKEQGEVQEVVLYGKATSTFITEPGRMSRVQKYLFDKVYTKPELSVIKPLGYYPEQNVLLRYEAPGATLRSYLEKASDNKEEITKGLINTALWAARLHKINKVPKYFPRKDDFALIRHFKRVFKEQGPKSLLKEYTELYNEFIEKAKAQEEGLEKRLIHGDFHPDNVFITDEGLMAIDFDDTGLSDPAQDLGSFLVQMRNMIVGVDQDQINEWQQLFLEKYFENSEIGENINERINLMQARTIFKNLSHHVSRHDEDYDDDEKIKLDFDHIKQLFDLVDNKSKILITY